MTEVRIDKAFVYCRGDFVGVITPTARDCDRLGWRKAAIKAARREWGYHPYHITSAPYEEDRHDQA